MNLEVGESEFELFAEVLLLLEISELAASDDGIVVGLFSLMKCILAK